MKINKGTKIEKTDKGYKVDFQYSKIKKVTSRMFPILLGKNDFQSVGYGVLDRAGMLSFTEIDPFYKVRGGIAEYIAIEYLKGFYKHNYKVDIEFKTFTPQEFEGFDMFHESYPYGNAKFGGTPDLTLTNPKEHRAVVEVKSKNMKHYDFIVEEGNIPTAEFMQGQLLSYLSKTDKVVMAYVFFTNEQESAIRTFMKENSNMPYGEMAQELGFSYRNVKTKINVKKIYRDVISTMMEMAHNNLHRAVKSGVIPFAHFNESEIKAIDSYIESLNEKDKGMFDSFEKKD